MTAALRFLLLGLLCVLGCLPVLAQTTDPPGRLSFQSYGREAGLGSLRINLLLQDKPGFIWAATDRGMYRFDGRRFTAHGLEQGLPALEVNALQLDADGALWVGTTRGLVRWDGQRFEAQPSGFTGDLSVQEMLVGPDQTLWVATKAGLFHGGAAGFRPQAGWTGGQINTLALGADGKSVWAGTRKSLWLWTAAQGWQLFPGQPRLVGEELDRLLAAPDGRLWLRSSRQTYVLDPGASEFRLLPMPVADSFLARPQLGGDGAVWMPTEKGLYRFADGALSSIGLAEGLPTDFARAVLLDREGNLWCGSLGLHRLMGRGAWRAHTPKDGLPAYVWAIKRDRAGGLWVGTEKGLARGGAAGWSVVPGSEGHKVRGLVEAADGSIIYGGEPYGLHRVTPKAGKPEALSALPGRDGRKIMALLMDRSERLWVGTQSAGLLQGRQVDGRWAFESVLLPGAPETGERISHLTQDRRGHVWAASSAGLLRWDGQTWLRLGTADGLASVQLLYAAEGRGDDLWLVYRDKPGVVSRLQLSGDRPLVTQTLGPPLLPAVDIALVGEDAPGRLWIGGNAGMDVVLQVRAERPSLLHFGVEDGLVDEEFNAMAILAEPDGRMWAGTRGGLAEFDPTRFRGEPAPPQVAVLEASLGERLLGSDSAPREAGFRENTFEIKFAALSYLDVGGLELQGRLMGLESDWHPMPAREARYAGLPPGEYTMQARARFRKGAWGPALSLPFSILPPWWQTWWFRALALLTVAALLLLVDRRRAQVVRRRTALLEQLVATRTQDLEAANQALKDLSLTDTLTRLHNRRYLLEVMPEYVAMAERGSSVNALLQSTRLTPCSDLTLIMVDIDKFKSINDSHGHAAGDAVLQQVAQILRECTRESDTVVRWGGEEFAVIARQVCRAELTHLPERIRARFATHEFDLGNGQTLKRSCSLGFALYPFFATAPQHIGWEQVLGLADQCLYAAKRGGRNAWVGLLPSEGAAPESVSDRLAGDLDGLVRDGLLEVHTSLPEAGALHWQVSSA